MGDERAPQRGIPLDFGLSQGEALLLGQRDRHLRLLLAGGIFAGLISDYTGGRATTCCVMLVVAAPMVRCHAGGGGGKKPPVTRVSSPLAPLSHGRLPLPKRLG